MIVWEENESMNSEIINISIEAQGAETRQLIASLINSALSEVGFTNIDAGIASREDETSRVVDSKKLPSLLDEMRLVNPQLFERPVKLLAIPYSTDPFLEQDGPHLLKDNIHTPEFIEKMMDTAVDQMHAQLREQGFVDAEGT